MSAWHRSGAAVRLTLLCEQERVTQLQRFSDLAVRLDWVEQITSPRDRELRQNFHLEWEAHKQGSGWGVLVVPN